MPLSIVCPKCKKQLRVADTAAGKRIKCPGCATVFQAGKPASTPATAAAPAKPKAVAPPPVVKPAVPPADGAEKGPDASLSGKAVKKKKSKALLYGCLTAVFVVLLLIGLGIAGVFWLLNKSKNALDDWASSVTTRKTVDLKSSPPDTPKGTGQQQKPKGMGQQPLKPPAGRQAEIPPASPPKEVPGGKFLAGFAWKEFKHPKGLYTVLMPKPPREQDGGITFTAADFDVSEFIGYHYTVMYSKREDEDRTVEEQIKDWRKANTDPERKLLKDQAIQVKGHAGWEIVYKKPEKKEFERKWFVKLKQGVAFVSMMVPDNPEWIASADKFFGSFTPLDK